MKTLNILLASFFMLSTVGIIEKVQLKISHVILFWPRREKICLRGFANNTGTDQICAV